MGMEEYGEQKTNAEKTEKGYSLIQIILGVIMLYIGLHHLPAATEVDTVATTISEETAAETAPLPSEESDPCPNGAAYYLYVAGIVILVTNLVSIVSRISKYLAMKDGTIDCGEACGLGFLSFALLVLFIADIAMLIWGSVLVFGAWSTWTDDYATYAAAPEELNYCAYQPMMTAFVILIIKWVLIPLLMALICCCGCLCACFGIKAASSAQNTV
eukprot:GFUD01052682.1.p1 GENE.GFUD01052682.1~~GFUD01052682.1.p1  ORF type:complete len:215 (-),score=51.47 GFUD01052682.1:114-758(-)